ncbi:MAG: immune inhibitor A domain-containing protein [Propionibacteriaceae bacterium]
MQSPTAKGDKVRDELPNAAEDKRRALRERALTMVLKGEAKVETKNGSQVVKIGTKKATLSRAQEAQVRRGVAVRARTVDQYVELSRDKTDKIFVVLAEFGDTRATDIDPRYGDVDTNTAIPGPTTFDGPLHNAIPEPDRSTDNSTIWRKNFSADYFRNIYFGRGQSLATYYEKQSSGRYSVEGEVTDWVKVKYNEARYGRSDGFPCASNVCSNTWNLLTDSLTQWVADQKAKGRTTAEITADLKGFDQWDRYDYDGDGNFNEPDGYLDHFQVVHSGGDQADGDPNQGEDAIWSHRWYAYSNLAGQTGPSTNPLGGTQIGDTGLWVGDYTIQPENGGLSVFAHEYGHDLGLPDHYDTAGGPDNAVNWWTLMAQSRARKATDVGIGTRPADLGVWDKLQLGWLDYETAVAGQKKTFKLGPHEYNSSKPQGLVVVLPDKQVTTTLVTPASGTKQWWSGSGNNLSSSLTRTVAVPSGSSQLSFKANYDIEEGYDYAVLQVDDGSGYQNVETSLSTVAANQGIDGSSGGAYVNGTADMSAFAGKSVTLRFRYVTDGGAAGNDLVAGNDGLFLDDIALKTGSTTVFSDGAENGANGWTADGFTAVGASITKAYDQFYLASNRTYESYDQYLRAGPYNFGFPDTPDKVEFFPYQTGLLVNYWDTSFSDNNESVHPGGGLVLPIDSRPDTVYNLEGTPWRGRIQTYDAPFSRQKADSFTLHINGKPSYVRGKAAQPLFDDTRSYWRAEQPTVGVKTPGVGVTLRVTKQDNTSLTVRLGASPNKKVVTTHRVTKP